MILETNSDRKDINWNFIVVFIFIFSVIDSFEAFDEPKTFSLAKDIVALACITD